jgi:hypothetical protein
MPWMGLRETLWSVASAVPGVGHICVLHKRATGLILISGCLLALLGAALYYKTRAADVLVYAVVTTSAFSMWSVMRSFRKAAGAEDERLISDFGIALVVIAVYFSSYVMIYTLANQRIAMARVNNTQTFTRFAADDDLLLMRNSELKRSDIVVGENHQDVLVLGPIVGMPGDDIQINDRVYINGKPTSITVQRNEGAIQSQTRIILMTDQFWIPTLPEWRNQNPNEWLRAGVVNRSNVLGKVIAVLGPPAHRRWMYQTH